MSHPYIPDDALRRRLGWGDAHDLMAAKIRDEFQLKMPRDRELIRQLTLLRIAQGQRVYAPEPDSGLTFDRDKGISAEDPKNKK